MTAQPNVPRRNLRHRIARLEIRQLGLADKASPPHVGISARPYIVISSHIQPIDFSSI
jgi:hypothetical protein